MYVSPPSFQRESQFQFLLSMLVSNYLYFSQFASLRGILFTYYFALINYV